MTVSVSVVLPDDSGPKTSTTAAARKSADAERAVDEDVAGRNDVDIDNLLVAEAHDRAFAEVLGDLLDRQIEVLVPRRGDFIVAGFLLSFRGHIRRL